MPSGVAVNSQGTGYRILHVDAITGRRKKTSAMAKSGMSSGFGGTTTFAFGSSDLHRVPSKPFAPAQGLKALEGAQQGTLRSPSLRSLALTKALCVSSLRARAGTFAREKNARVSEVPSVEFHPRRLKLDHGGISQWDHASPKCRAVLANMTSYDELERRLMYHRKGRVEEPMLRGLLQTYNCTFHLEDTLAGGILHHYYMVRAHPPAETRAGRRP